MRAGPFRVGFMRYAAGAVQPTHAHGESGLTLVLAGSIAERVGRVDEVGEPLSVVIKPAGVEHADVVGPRGAYTLRITFDPAAIAANMDDVPREWRWLHGGPAVRRLVAVARRIARSQSRLGIEDGIYDALGVLGDDPVLRGSPPAWLRRVREILDDAFPERVTIRMLASAVGAHPVSVSRAFRRHYGRSVTAYRRWARVRRAAKLIPERRRDLSAAAFDAGYADHSHLCREFRTATGIGPGEYRVLVTRP
ncbi:MAG TPA: AraC family transcriptional regulator [Gemmatimonadales bacterium]|nr:AraC family transcriptional regulator [Gemmatimonadales bacterium]